MTAGRVGRPHGLDGNFTLKDASAELEVGTTVWVGGREHTIERLGGTPGRRLLRLDGIGTREDAARLGGELMLVPAGGEEPLGEGEWLAEDLVGCRIEGLGEVRRVIGGSSCDVLELDDGTLVPLVSDAVPSVDLGARRIEVDRAFLGLER